MAQSSEDRRESSGGSSVESSGTGSVTRYRFLQIRLAPDQWVNHGVAFETGGGILCWYAPLRGPITLPVSRLEELGADDLPIDQHVCRWSESVLEWFGPFIPYDVLQPQGPGKTHANNSPAPPSEESGGVDNTSPVEGEEKPPVASPPPEENMSAAPTPRAPTGQDRNVFQERSVQYRNEKRCIAEYIAFWLRTRWVDSAISVDGGTTNECVVAAICRDARLPERRTVGKIISNNLMALLTIGRLIDEGQQPAAESTGGTLRPTRWTLLGQVAVEAIERALFDVAIVGANGFCVPDLATTTATEQQVKRAMIERATAKEVVFPMDAYKWGKAVGAAFCNLHELVQRGMRVYLVTAYPRQQEDEGIDAFSRRLDSFLKTATKLVATWKDRYREGAITVVFSKVDLPGDLLNAPPPELKFCRCEEVKPEVDFFEQFVERIPWGAKGHSGLAIAFELRGQ